MTALALDTAKKMVKEFFAAIDTYEESRLALRDIVWDMHEKRIWESYGLKTFKEFVKEVLPVQKSQAYHLLSEARVNETVSKYVPNTAPLSGRALKEFGKIKDTTVRVKVASRAAKIASKDGDEVVTITPTHIKSAAEAVAKKSSALDSKNPNLGEVAMGRVWEFDAALAPLRRAFIEIKRLDEDAVLGAFFDNDALRLVNRLGGIVKNAKPHTICPSCVGTGCTVCGSMGWMPQDVYENAVKAHLI